MAGEWIPYDVCLPQKPEVLELVEHSGSPVGGPGPDDHRVDVVLSEERQPQLLEAFLEGLAAGVDSADYPTGDPPAPPARRAGALRALRSGGARSSSWSGRSRCTLSSTRRRRPTRARAEV